MSDKSWYHNSIDKLVKELSDSVTSFYDSQIVDDNEEMHDIISRAVGLFFTNSIISMSAMCKTTPSAISYINSIQNRVNMSLDYLKTTYSNNSNSSNTIN